MKAAALVGELASAKTVEVPQIVAQLSGQYRWAHPLLADMLQTAAKDSKRRLHASLALLPNDPGQVDYLYEQLFLCDPEAFPVIRDALLDHRKELARRLWTVLETPRYGQDRRFRAACALAVYGRAGDKQYWNRWEKSSELVADQFVTIIAQDRSHYAPFVEALRPVRQELLAPLTTICRDAARNDSQRSLAANILADYMADRPEALADLLMEADTSQFALFFAKLQAHGDRAAAILESELDKGLASGWKDRPLDPSWDTPDPAVVQKVEASQGMLAERFGFCQTMLLEDFAAVAERLRSSGYRPAAMQAYAAGESVQAAVVWTRDGRDWKLLHGATAAEVRQQDVLWRDEGFVRYVFPITWSRTRCRRTTRVMPVCGPPIEKMIHSIRA